VLEQHRPFVVMMRARAEAAKAASWRSAPPAESEPMDSTTRGRSRRGPRSTGTSRSPAKSAARGRVPVASIADVAPRRSFCTTRSSRAERRTMRRAAARASCIARERTSTRLASRAREAS
jgi:hypothetical protein